jgi:ion channel-forming bestrophin family protein
MHSGRSYSFKEVFLWTFREIVAFTVLGLIPPTLYLLGVPLPKLPWQPVALVGTSVAFITGFKSNAAYNRVWEARQIYGGIVNASRAFSNQVHGFITDEARRMELIRRHLAWLTALRFQLREPRAWEQMTHPANRAYQERTYEVPERTTQVLEELAKYLSAQDLAELRERKNRAIHLLGQQGRTLRALVDAHGLTELRHIELERQLSVLFDLQGRAERIKNFPYPRQFATINYLFVSLLVLLLPMSLFGQFMDLGPNLMWLTAPSMVLIGWVFHTMDKVGESSENPFQGGANDIPISAMSRNIEIDLLELAGVLDTPPPLQAKNNILM